MKDFEILVDTAADLDEEFQQQYNIKLINGHISIDGKEIDAFVKWEKMSREEFYSALKANPDKFKTSPPSVGQMAEFFEDCAKAGKGVLYITISSGLSGTYNFALQAKEMVEEKYPDAVITVVDSMRFGPAIGLMACNAAMLRAQGKDMDEVAQYVIDNKNRYHQAGWLDDLSYVAKQGRITHPKAFFGTLVGIKPIGEFDYNGLTTVLGKAKGEKTAFDVLVKYIKATINNPEDQIIFIAQSNRLKQAQKYKAIIEETFKPKAVYIKDVYPACGTNIGPGLMAAYYVGNEISADLSVEKDLIKEYIGA